METPNARDYEALADDVVPSLSELPDAPVVSSGKWPGVCFPIFSPASAKGSPASGSDSDPVSCASPLLRQGNHRAGRDAIPVYRDSSLVAGLQVGRGQAATGGKRPLQEYSCKHFGSGVPSTVMGQAPLGNGASGTWRLAGVMGQRQLRNGDTGTWTLR